MIQTNEISTDHLVRALRIYVNDLTDKHSPFSKKENYMHDLAAWIACAATRLEALAPLQGIRDGVEYEAHIHTGHMGGPWSCSICGLGRCELSGTNVAEEQGWKSSEEKL